MTRAPRGGPWLTVLIFLGAVGTEVVLAVLLASGAPLAPGHHRFVVVLVFWGVAFAVAAWAALRLPRRGATGLIVAAGLAVRLAALAGPPTSSDDLFRYSWDGRVQTAGIDAYAQPPAAGPVAGLRDGWLWPDPKTCAALGRPPGCSRINRVDARTIYPPAAEAWFEGVYRVAGIGARHKAWQVAGLVTEAATLALLAVALGRFGRDRRWLALYALCPVPAIELVNNGHVDGLAILLAVAALVVSRRPGQQAGGSAEWWRDVAAAALLTGAALVKLYPAALLLPLVACRPGRRAAAWCRAGLTTAILTLVAYAPHVARVGTRVLGYLPGYLSEEHYGSGGRFLIAGVLQVPGEWPAALSGAAVVLTAGWIVLRRPPLPEASAALVAAVLLATSPAQPWYAVTLVALAAVARRPAYLAVVAAGYAAAISATLDRPDSALIGGLAYGAALLVVLAAAASRRRRGQSGAELAVGAADHRQANGETAPVALVAH